VDLGMPPGRKGSAQRNRLRREARRGQPPVRCADCGAVVDKGVDGAVRCWGCLEIYNGGRRRYP
jgi:hypothetical protein